MAVAGFVRVAALAEVPEGSATCVLVKRRKIALFHVDGKIFATDDTCTHADASLTEGCVEGQQVICPLHGARFDVTTGAALTRPAVTPVDTYPVKVENGEIFVEL